MRKLREGYSTINKQVANSFSFPFLLSFIVFVLATTVDLLINGEVSDISAALPTYCSSLFSTTITFCFTTTIQNILEVQYTDRDFKTKSLKFNVWSLLYSVAYLFFFIIYLLIEGVLTGIIFLILSGVAILLSFLAFVETYKTENSSISG